MSDMTNGPRWSAEDVREPTGLALDEWIADTVVASMVDPVGFEARRRQAAHWHPRVWRAVLDALPPAAPDAGPAGEYGPSPLTAKLLGMLKVPGEVGRGGPSCDCPACRAKRGALADRAGDERRAQIRDEALRLMEANRELLPEDAVARVLALEAAVARLPDVAKPGA